MFKVIIVYIIFVLIILLWMFGLLYGMNFYLVVLIFVVVFLVTGIIGKEDLKMIFWDVLWLVFGGIVLGLVLDKTGLVELVVYSILFD